MVLRFFNRPSAKTTVSRRRGGRETGHCNKTGDPGETPRQTTGAVGSRLRQAARRLVSADHQRRRLEGAGRRAGRRLYAGGREIRETSPGGVWYSIQPNRSFEGWYGTGNPCGGRHRGDKEGAREFCPSPQTGNTIPDCTGKPVFTRGKNDWRQADQRRAHPRTGFEGGKSEFRPRPEWRMGKQLSAMCRCIRSKTARNQCDGKAAPP